MTVQAQFHKMKFQVSRNKLRSLGSLSSSRSLEREEKSTTKKKKTTTKVKNELQAASFEVSYTSARSIGTNPRTEYATWLKYLKRGTYAPFYLGKTRFLGMLFILTDVQFEAQAIDGRGNVLVGEITLTFQQFIRNKKRQRVEQKAIKLHPGIKRKAAKSAVKKGASKSAKASVKKSAKKK